MKKLIILTIFLWAYNAEAQTKAISIIKDQLSKNFTVFDYGKTILENRWEIIKNTDFKFTIHSQQGMFLWCQGKCPKGILHMTGDKFGSNNDYFRLNIGCSSEDFIKFLNLCQK